MLKFAELFGSYLPSQDSLLKICQIAATTHPWSEKYEKEPRWYGDLCQVSQMWSLREADECGKRFVEFFQLAHQNVGGLGTGRNLFHEVVVLILQLVRAVITTKVTIFTRAWNLAFIWLACPMRKEIPAPDLHYVQRNYEWWEKFSNWISFNLKILKKL